MSGDKWTAGDWDTEEADTLCDMLSSASHHDLERYDSERDRFIQRARTLANMVHEHQYLIAAAPDMAAVLADVVAHFDGTDAPIGVAARAALAKAKGETR